MERKNERENQCDRENKGEVNILNLMNPLLKRMRERTMPKIMNETGDMDIPCFPFTNFKLWLAILLQSQWWWNVM